MVEGRTERAEGSADNHPTPWSAHQPLHSPSPFNSEDETFTSEISGQYEDMQSSRYPESSPLRHWCSICAKKSGPGDAVKRERHGAIFSTCGPEYAIRPHGVSTDRSR